jgi:hypothetical protein
MSIEQYINFIPEGNKDGCKKEERKKRKIKQNRIFQNRIRRKKDEQSLENSKE